MFSAKALGHSAISNFTFQVTFVVCQPGGITSVGPGGFLIVFLSSWA